MSIDTGRPLFTIAEAAAYLNIPTTTLRDKVTRRAVPFTRIGRHVRFTPDHIAAIIAAGETTVLPPPPQRASRRRHRSAPRPSAA
ncbi:MAG TPA: helix-turn-helix domain-containing protein [Mycobacteriales bacterium]|jgi:excisionase family DNA binding protein|nr:helix-turn-helix domain-containing protein [Mycobacteriales bacterium]